jgi:hypothetical protein
VVVVVVVDFEHIAIVGVVYGVYDTTMTVFALSA